MDFAEHNAEVRAAWAAYHEGRPYRVPMTLGVSERFYLSDPSLNREGITYLDYHNDPDAMLRVQLSLEHLRRHAILADHEMGLPERWTVCISGGNFSHSAWYGCPVYYGSNDSPDTTPILNDDNKEMLFDRGVPDPFSGIYGTFRDMLERMQERIRGLSFHGREVDPRIDAPPASTMGNGIPFTTACKLRGATAMCADMLLDPPFAQRLLAYVTDSIVNAIRRWRALLGRPVRTQTVLLGDDSCVLLSPEMYRQFVLPHHRRIYEEFGTPGALRAVHLCGAAQKHLPILAQELGVRMFDTGFPLDLRALYREVGPEVRIDGGLPVELLRAGAPDRVRRESRRILESLKEYPRFVFRDANLLAPCTPQENLRAMYAACRRYGRYTARP